MTTPTVTLRHVHTTLALHQLSPAPAGAAARRPLLLLHGLGEQTPAQPLELTATWPGEVWGLDFTGHGQSSVPRGGGYTAETLMADVDVALSYLIPAGDDHRVCVVGRGLGGYVALLISGARPELVSGVVILDGPGLAGGGPAPHSTSVTRTRLSASDSGPATSTPDPYALLELSRDVRPGDYAVTYARQAVEFSGLDHPITVAARSRPPWLEEVVDTPGVVEGTLEAALRAYSS